MDSHNIPAESNDSTLFRDAFRRASSFLPASVAVVAGFDSQGRPFGFTASSLTIASIAPPLLCLFVDGDSPRARGLRRAERFSANVLTREQAKLATRFATSGIDRFAGVDWHSSPFGPPVLEAVLGVFLCEFKHELETGDRSLIIADVRELALSGGEPIVYWRRAFHSIELDYPFAENEEALNAFIEGWKTGTLPKHRWTHGAHVAVAAYFAFDHTPETAFQKTKAGILHFNSCVGTLNTDDHGYHETLTRFWSDMVGAFVREARFGSRIEAVRRAVAAFGADRDRHRLFYSFDVTQNRDARRRWMAPNRNPPADWLGGSGRVDRHT